MSHGCLLNVILNWEIVNTNRQGHYAESLGFKLSPISKILFVFNPSN